MQRLRSANAKLRHSSGPNGNVGLFAKIMNLYCIPQATNALNLDVHNPAAFHLDCLTDCGHILCALVKTDGGFDHPLKSRMSFEVILRQRLLYHDELKIIKSLQVREVASAVGTI